MARLAIVTPWFGRALKGGAEQLAWQLATRLADVGHQVCVLTTCCESFLSDWSENHLPAGVSSEDGVQVHRFPVDPRATLKFDVANGRLLAAAESAELYSGMSLASGLAGKIFCEDNIHSEALMTYLRAQAQADEKGAFDRYIFLPYLYGIVLSGLPIVASRSILVPCLHDEIYAYLPSVWQIFRDARWLAFNSEGEKELALQIFGPAITGKSKFIGSGAEGLSEATHVDLPERFFLCLGRRTTHKNTDFLINAFHRFRQQTGAEHSLVLAGPGDTSYDNPDEGILDLGLVSEGQKTTLLKRCQGLFHASLNESYSRVMMEAWLCHKPVVVHARCLATAAAVRSSQGGLVADSEADWAEAFETLATANSQTMERWVSSGHAYAKAYASWPSVIERLEALVEPLPEQKVALPPVRGIDQIIVSLVAGDAISQQALVLRDYWRGQGVESTIYAESTDGPMEAEATLYPGRSPHPDNVLLYHHSIGSAGTTIAVNHQGPKGLLYHNITPSSFFHGYSAGLEKLLEKGRAELPQLAPAFQFSLADSAYNAQELTQVGFADPRVLPIVVDNRRWRLAPDPGAMQRLSDGRTNILFVGRIAPNKCQHHLLEVLQHLVKIDPSCRLVLCGSMGRRDRYAKMLKRQIRRLKLQQHVLVMGHASESQLHAAYKTAHLYLSMSEHEGFGVPLIEAMWFDVPVMAYGGSAVSETTGAQCIIFDEKSEWPILAGVAAQLIHDPDVRQPIIQAQRRWRTRYLPQQVLPRVNEYIQALLESNTAE